MCDYFVYFPLIFSFLILHIKKQILLLHEIGIHTFGRQFKICSVEYNNLNETYKQHRFIVRKYLHE